RSITSPPCGWRQPPGGGPCRTRGERRAEARRSGGGVRMGATGRRSPVGAATAAAILALALLPVSTAEAKRKVRYNAVAIQPGLAESAEIGREAAGDAARLAYFALVLTPGIDVRWRPLDPPARETFALTAPAAGARTGGRGEEALEGARRMLG